ncbi:M23 family metallopeptidase [Subdoligranulum variabile]|uniref:Peptidase, M23 family n=1 Tax=Subdoligranulum variabile DSM 15176 TaxID=411471 RepID=D1PLA7_9FIRM|nr:M23 family metallopeptidase [Subdoligranulum variabile]EFB76765.1 peptidase, M23 family [Subdoligranulum variabile DSM 15176]UWP68013.1 M23 family metallopeptidase [Subdoligranulum variabile]
MTKEEQSVALQSAARLATAMQTGIYNGRSQIVYSYGCYGYTRGGGATWHGGLDLVGLDDKFIRMPSYKGKAIQGTVTRARIVTDHCDKTWEWGWYVCVQMDAAQTPDEVNFLYFCHCKELLVQVGQKVKTGDILAIMGQTGNAAGGYDHCHLEARATATGKGLDPTAYSGTDNAVGIYGTKPATEPDKTAQDLTAVPNSQLNTIQLVSLAPLTDEQMRQADSLAETLGLTDSEHYKQLRLGDSYFAAVFSVSSGDAIKVLALAQKNGWDKLERYHSRFVG